MFGSTASRDAPYTEESSAQERGITSEEGPHPGEEKEAVTLTKICEGVPQEEYEEEHDEEEQ